MAESGGNQVIETTEEFRVFHWITCMFCPQKFLNKEDHREHVIITHPRTPRETPALSIACDFCASTFPDNLRLFRHQDVNHFNSLKHIVRVAYKCTVCQLDVADLTSFEVHSTEERHTSWIIAQLSVCRLFHCRFCDKKFSNFTILRSHQRIQHRVIPKEEECGKLTYSTRKPNRRGRLDFFPARPRGRPPKVRIEDEAGCSLAELDEEERVEDTLHDQINVTTVEEEIDGFGCPFCTFFDVNYDTVAQHTSDHYQAILDRQQQPGVEEGAKDQVMDLNSELVTFMGRDRSFLEYDDQNWEEDTS